MNLGIDQTFNFADMNFSAPMIEAMIFMENGRQPYDDSIIEQAFELALKGSNGNPED